MICWTAGHVGTVILKTNDGVLAIMKAQFGGYCRVPDFVPEYD